MFVVYSSSNFPTRFVNVWLILHIKILQNNFYINAFSINFLVNVNWGVEGPPNVNACQQGRRGGRKSRKSCQRSLRMTPKDKKNPTSQIINMSLNKSAMPCVRTLQRTRFEHYFWIRYFTKMKNNHQLKVSYRELQGLSVLQLSSYMMSVSRKISLKYLIEWSVYFILSF